MGAWMKIGVCGIACEICPLMVKGKCPNGNEGCAPNMNDMCRISTCAFGKGIRYRFECSDFPCDKTKFGPIACDHCLFISGE
jgi:hypothetical protein